VGLKLELFEAYQKRHGGSVNRALAETIQAVALLGLARTDFFSHAAFYGGTALRLLYNLDRFSEDLDFSLLTPVEEFQFTAYLGSLRDEMEAFGFSVDIEKRQKGFDSPIESAFIKANTRIHVIRAGIPRAIAERIHRDALCKVKLEVDTDPPPDAAFDVVYIDDPLPFSIQAYSGPSLFAGKMDAVLSRGWKNRVKGRDWYDFAFLVRKKFRFHCRIWKHGSGKKDSAGWKEHWMRACVFRWLSSASNPWTLKRPRAMSLLLFSDLKISMYGLKPTFIMYSEICNSHRRVEARGDRGQRAEIGGQREKTDVGGRMSDVGGWRIERMIGTIGWMAERTG
jgi:predicted nucleotidyltransferase component of viral defense system